MTAFFSCSLHTHTLTSSTIPLFLSYFSSSLLSYSVIASIINEENRLVYYSNSIHILFDFSLVLFLSICRTCSFFICIGSFVSLCFHLLASFFATMYFVPPNMTEEYMYICIYKSNSETVFMMKILWVFKLLLVFCATIFSLMAQKKKLKVLSVKQWNKCALVICVYVWFVSMWEIALFSIHAILVHHTFDFKLLHFSVFSFGIFLSWFFS